MTWHRDADLQSIGSRFTSDAVFVTPGHYLENSDVLDPALMEPEDWDVEFAPYTVRRQQVGSGRGASGSALAIYLASGLIAIGGVKDGLDALRATARFWRRLRDKHRDVTLSHGAVQGMAVLQILNSEPSLALEDLRVLPVVDVNPRDKSELNHTGIDMMVVSVINSDNTTSWLFMVDAQGKVLHASKGGPLPTLALAYLGIGLDIDFELDRQLGPFLSEPE